MLLKSAGSQDELISSLEALLKQATGDRKAQIEKELRIRRAGARAESEAAYFIDFDYRDSQNYIVIHDLRLEINSRVAQIDHLLINRLLGCFVLETKSFHSGLKITEEGEFLRWNDGKKTFEGMASPLMQNERHIAVLRDAFSQIDMPTRLGIRLSPSYHSFVLVSANARVDRPKKFDTSQVIKTESLKAAMEKYHDSANTLQVFGGLAKMVSTETLQEIGKKLVALHRPAPSDVLARFREAAPAPERQPVLAARPTPAPTPQSGGVEPKCRECGGQTGGILYGKYGYYFKCATCDGNTAIKVSCGKPGHKERIRKEGRQFFRECADCGSSTLYFLNPS
jgi:hypothetical protein